MPMLSITKLQNLKAIHNPSSPKTPVRKVVINHKTTKFESNSQHFHLLQEPLVCCYQSQNYKIRKQFTTSNFFFESKGRMLSITKLQNLKAIRNRKPINDSGQLDVINHKTTKFESNSQLFLHKKVLICFII